MSGKEAQTTVAESTKRGREECQAQSPDTGSEEAESKRLHFTDRMKVWKEASPYPGITNCPDVNNPYFNCKGMFENGESKHAINPYILVYDKDRKLYKKSLVGIELIGGVYDKFPYGSYKVSSVDGDSLSLHYRWPHCNVSVNVDGKEERVTHIYFDVVNA